MVNCFHHLRPAQARAVLQSAYEHREPILIYEMVGHLRLPWPLWPFALPFGLCGLALMACVNSALVRPVTFKQLLFTYLIPLIPIFYAWDGSASLSRIYSARELDEILQGLDGEGYRWEKGSGKLGPLKIGTYLMGTPV